MFSSLRTTYHENNQVKKNTQTNKQTDKKQTNKQTKNNQTNKQTSKKYVVVHCKD